MSANVHGSKWIRPEKRLAVYLRDGFTCVYCGRDLSGADPHDVTLDHLRPRSKGGSNRASNLVTACRPCNSARGARPWRDLADPSLIRRLTRRKLDLTHAKALLQGDREAASVA